MRTTTITLLTALTLVFSGCVVHHHEDDDCEDGYCADIGFFWRFELFDGDVTTSCFEADVSRVNIFIYDFYDDLVYEKLNRPCSDEGAIITDFYPDTYTLVLEGINPDDFVTHEGIWEIDVYEGSNEFGYLTLDYLD